MNIKTTISFVSSVFILLSVVGSSFAQENDIKNRLRVRFPRMQVGEIRQSGIDGLYEVEAGPNILYYYPKSELVVFGEIWNSAGKSLTAERRSEIFSRKVRDIPLDKAGLKIGNGKNVVIEFTNPDCNYCRKGYEYMKSRDDVTEYIFFLPFNKTSESR